MNPDTIYNYDELMQFFKTNIYESEYSESHHILPKCEGGDDTDDNLVKLPFKFHMRAHYLRGLELLEKNPSLAYKHFHVVKMMSKQSHISKVLKEYLKLEKSFIESNQYCMMLKEKYGLRFITNGEKSIKIIATPEEVQKYEKQGYRFGRTFKSPKNKKWITNGSEYKYLPEEEATAFIDNNIGWYFGMVKTDKMIEAHKKMFGKKGTTTGKIWVNKEGTKKNISPDELNEYIANGWKKGHGGKTCKGKHWKWSKGYHWYNNGKESKLAIECPEGYVLGRIV